MRLQMMLLALAMTMADGAASAQVPPLPALPPEGQTVLNVSTMESVEVEEDLLTASLRVDRQGADPKALQDEINSLMAQALAKAKAAANIQTSTGQYYVYPVSDSPERRKDTARRWQGSQSLQLKSSDAAAMLGLIGDLQALGLVMDNLAYTLSPEKAEAVRDGLMERTLVKLRAKAERAAKALGKSTVELIEVTVDPDNQVVPPRPMMAAMSMRKGEQMADPSAEPGTERIVLTVSARALLKP